MNESPNLASLKKCAMLLSLGIVSAGNIRVVDTIDRVSLLDVFETHLWMISQQAKVITPVDYDDNDEKSSKRKRISS